MTAKVYAILTDIHSNLESLKQAIEIIKSRPQVDQLICLGDCFALGPEPLKTLKLLQTLDNCIFIRGNHDRYLLEKLWEKERPALEGMDPDDPICKAIVANEAWTAEELGTKADDFLRRMHISYRERVNGTLVEFTHAWYHRDDQPPSMEEAIHWRDHVLSQKSGLTSFIFVHGHIHVPRYEESGNLKLLCQGSVGLPFDKDPRGAVAFLTVGDTFDWDVVRYAYNHQKTILQLEQKRPPFYRNIQNTVKHAAIRNDL